MNRSGLKLATMCSVWIALGGCAAGGGAEVERLPFDDYEASLPLYEEDGELAYIVERDTLIWSVEELRAYYVETFGEPIAEPAPAEGGVAAAEAPLIRTRDAAGDPQDYTSGTEDRLTYCVSESFSSTQRSWIISSIAAAAANWEGVAHVNFTYVSSSDEDCDSNPSAVWFSVVPSTGAATWAFAFAPDEARSRRRVRIGSSVCSGRSCTGLLTHELGHILGFGHEHARPASETGFATACSASDTGIAVTAYDTRSVMHYPNGVLLMDGTDCGGDATFYSISRLDQLGVESIFGPPDGSCELASTETCAAQGATCQRMRHVNGTRWDMCRWPTLSSLGCSATLGIWTTSTSTFARNNPGSVLRGQAGACITDISNLSCSDRDRGICLRQGATCERATSTTGSRRDLCRWSDATTAAACGDTTGLWTPRDSEFDRSWPTSVTVGSGACVSQVQNFYWWRRPFDDLIIRF